MQVMDKIINPSNYVFSLGKGGKVSGIFFNNFKITQKCIPLSSFPHIIKQFGILVKLMDLTQSLACTISILLCVWVEMQIMGWYFKDSSSFF